MKKVNRLLWLIALCLPIFINAQSDTSSKGIKWVEGLTWEQVKQKAKAELKYIFVDAYTTWCGPCKMMDKNVYVDDNVGQFFNDKFISVKVQMDRTTKDNEEIRSWYEDADAVSKQYHVDAYPSFIFLNLKGEIVHKATGFKPVHQFIEIAKAALVSGKVFNDEYTQYEVLVSAYKQGERNYDQYPSIIKVADKLLDTVLSRQLTKELTDYVSALPDKERYTKERIEFWNNYTWLSNTRIFDFFYKDARLINGVMNRMGYAENFIDKTIQYEIMIPFLKEQANGSGIAMEGMHLSGPNMKLDYSEADWKRLDKIIRTKYGKAYARRNVLIARVEWYSRHRNIPAVIKVLLLRLNRYPPDLTEWGTTTMINGPAWEAFLTVNDKKILKGYAKWMKEVVQVWPNKDNYIDTYANLLYKLGHKKEAIEWEEKAVKLAPKDESLSATLQQMKRGEPTYLNEGAIWEKVRYN